MKIDIQVPMRSRGVGLRIKILILDFKRLGECLEERRDRLALGVTLFCFAVATINPTAVMIENECFSADSRAKAMAFDACRVSDAACEKLLV